MAKTWAVVRTSFEGYHFWPDAPAEVSFLRDMHRHIFHVRVAVEQMHDERDVEYILLKRWLDDGVLPTLETHVLHGKGSSLSCESMARKIALLVQYRYSQRDVIAEVSEDGENGAIVELLREP